RHNEAAKTTSRADIGCPNSPRASPTRLEKRLGLPHSASRRSSLAAKFRETCGGTVGGPANEAFRVSMYSEMARSILSRRKRQDQQFLVWVPTRSILGPDSPSRWSISSSND